MTTTARTGAEPVGIRELSELTGLTPDTLRWYEREGLLPLVSRTSGGQRRYGPAAVRFARLVCALRRTGMSVADVRGFVQVGPAAGPGSQQSHRRRMELLDSQRTSVLGAIAQLQQDLHLVDAKIADYRDLIARGADCEDAATPKPSP